MVSNDEEAAENGLVGAWRRRFTRRSTRCLLVDSLGGFCSEVSCATNGCDAIFVADDANELASREGDGELADAIVGVFCSWLWDGAGAGGVSFYEMALVDLMVWSLVGSRFLPLVGDNGMRLVVEIE